MPGPYTAPLCLAPAPRTFQHFMNFVTFYPVLP
jgi:hypothetical protein